MGTVLPPGSPPPPAPGSTPGWMQIGEKYNQNGSRYYSQNHFLESSIPLLRGTCAWLVLRCFLLAKSSSLAYSLYLIGAKEAFVGYVCCLFLDYACDVVQDAAGAGRLRSAPAGCRPLQLCLGPPVAQKVRPAAPVARGGDDLTTYKYIL